MTMILKHLPTDTNYVSSLMLTAWSKFKASFLEKIWNWETKELSVLQVELEHSVSGKNLIWISAICLKQLTTLQISDSGSPTERIALRFHVPMTKSGHIKTVLFAWTWLPNNAEDLGTGFSSGSSAWDAFRMTQPQDYTCSCGAVLSRNVLEARSMHVLVCKEGGSEIYMCAHLRGSRVRKPKLILPSQSSYHISQNQSRSCFVST